MRRLLLSLAVCCGGMALWSAAAGGQSAPAAAAGASLRSCNAAPRSSPRGARTATAPTRAGARGQGPSLRGAGAAVGRLLPVHRADADRRPDDRTRAPKPAYRAPTSTLSWPTSAPSADRRCRGVDPRRGRPAPRARGSSPTTAPAATRSSARGGIVTGGGAPRCRTPPPRRSPRRSASGPTSCRVLASVRSTHASWTRSRATSLSTRAPGRPRRLGHRPHRARSPRAWSRGCWPALSCCSSALLGERDRGEAARRLVAPSRVLVALPRAAARRTPRAADAAAIDPRRARLGAPTARGARRRPAPAARRPARVAFAVLLRRRRRHAAARPALGVALALSPRALIVAAKRVVAAGEGGRAARSAAAHRGRHGRSRAARDGGDGVSRRRAAGRRRRHAGAGARGRARRSRSPRSGPTLSARRRHAVAARAAPGRRATSEPLPADDDRDGRFVTALPAGRRQARARLARRRRARRPGDARPAAGPRRTGRPRDPRLLEDLHPRRLRGLAVPPPRCTSRRRRGPALVCPCHYSTFDVRRAAARSFGPAGRALPQLPLASPPTATLVAAGALSGRSARRGGACAE